MGSPHTPGLFHSAHDYTSIALVVSLSSIAASDPKSRIEVGLSQELSPPCCAISGKKVFWKNGCAPGLFWYNVLDPGPNTTVARGPGSNIGGKTSNDPENTKIAMLSHIYEFWAAGLVAIHPETFLVRCFVPSDVISDYDGKGASFSDLELPNRGSLRLHYEKCVWVNTTASLPRIPLELPLVANNDSIFHGTLEATIENIKALGVVDATCREYCTQKCLLGLKNGDLSDEGCPNYVKHNWPQRTKDSPQQLNGKSFNFLVQKQLEIDQSRFCQQPAVSNQGHHAEFFKVTLAGFGYTFCAKGVAVDDQHRLINEYIMYQKMADAQGVCVPVCLGLFALQRPFGRQAVSGLEITHMLLMSNAGTSVEKELSVVDKCGTPSEEVLQKESDRTMKEIRDTGVDRHDGRKKHLYWNAERERVFYIDFEKNNLIQEVDSETT